MSRADLERIRRGYEAFRRDGLDGILEHVHPDIEWVQDPAFPGAQTFHGHEGVRRWFERLSDSFGAFHVEVEDLVDAGDRIVVLLTVHTRGAESGVAVDTRMAHVWTLKDGKGSRVRFYLDPAAALRDVGAAR